MTVWSAICRRLRDDAGDAATRSIRVVGPAPGGGAIHRGGDRREAAARRRCTASRATCCWSRWRSRCSPRRWSISRCITCSCGRCGALTAKPGRLPRRIRKARRASSCRVQRGDEIGVAERELSDMQRDLVSMLHQKSRLAALGLAVSKINHDLRNLLASSQLISDQLASVPDPRVQRFAPKLMRSLERAIAFCQSTLSYGRAQEAAARPPHDPDRAGGRRGARVRRTGRGCVDRLDQRDRARASPIDADPDQLFRVLLNLVRNAAQALEGRPASDAAICQIRITGRREGSVAIIEVSDTGPGVPAQGARASVRGVPDLRRGPAAPGSALPLPPNWSAPMAATSVWSKAPSAPPSGSRSPTARWNSRASATSGSGRRRNSGRHSGAMRSIEPGISR